MVCSTCFGHLYAHHQELETILVLLPHVVCNVLVAGGRLLQRTTSNQDITHVEQIVSAIKHSVASIWFSALRLEWYALPFSSVTDVFRQ